MERSEAKIFMHEKCDSPVQTGKRHAAERAKLGLYHVFLDALHQRRGHSAKAIRLILGRQSPRETKTIAKDERAAFHASEFVNIGDHFLVIQLPVSLGRDLRQVRGSWIE